MNLRSLLNKRLTFRVGTAVMAAGILLVVMAAPTVYVAFLFADHSAKKTAQESAEAVRARTKDNARRIAQDRKTRVEGCVRRKRSDVASARAFTALSNYYEGVLAAQSVKQDVKDAATVVQNAVTASARETGSNLYLCVPQVYEGKLMPDLVARRKVGTLHVSGH